MRPKNDYNPIFPGRSGVLKQKLRGEGRNEGMKEPYPNWYSISLATSQAKN